MDPRTPREPRPPGQNANEEHPEISFTKEWGTLVRRARVGLKMTQEELGKKVDESQAIISYIESGKIGSSKAVVPLVEFLGIPPPRHFAGDELDERWLDAGRILRRVNENGFLGLLAAAEQMIAGSDPDPH